MRNDQIDDLKQFITAVISQQTADIREDVVGVKENLASVKNDLAGVKKDIAHLDQKIDNLAADVAEAIDKSNEETELTLTKHDKRIARLEKKAA